MEEGRTTKSGATYTYEYFLKDHLGNNRSGFKAATPGTASFRSDYYPFGLQYQDGIVVSSPENKYLYNGKELQKGTGMLDYGARQYDPVIGRWNVVDPLAEVYERFSPYKYTVNDPVGRLDPNGMWVTTINGERTEDPDEIAQLLAEVKQTKFNDDKKKKKETEDGKKSGGEKKGWTSRAAGIALTTATADGPLPIGDAIGTVVLTGAAIRDLSQITYVTYTLKNAEGQVYVGRTSGYGDPYPIMNNRFSGHHMKALGYGSAQLDRVAKGFPLGNYAIIRGREQDVINGYGGVGSHKLGNTRNGIWEYNPNKPLYMGASKLMFGPYVK